MTRRSNREGQRLTLSWLDDLGVKERDLQERRIWSPLATKPATPSPVPAPSLVAVGEAHFQTMIRKNRGDLLFDWATRNGYPPMRVVLPSGGTHIIVQGVAAWRATCEGCSLDIVEAAFSQTGSYEESFPPMTDGERGQRMTLLMLGQWREWARFAFTPPGSHSVLIIEATEAEWTRFAHHGLYPQVVEACALLEQEWNEHLLAWAENHGFRELTYCCADGSEGRVPAGEDAWKAFLDETDDQGRIQMALEAFDLDELEASRGE